jgi:ribosomal protein S18 acetylase RimI-like enzyme
MTGQWRKTGKGEIPGQEAFLRSREVFCVTAISRFLHRDFLRDHVWALSGGVSVDGVSAVSALLIQSRRTLFPVLGGNRDVPIPRNLNRFLRKISVHAIQGLRDEADVFEQALARLGHVPAERIDYNLMSLDRGPDPGALAAGPPGLVLRKPEIPDGEALFPLQAAYEQEEVLPRGAVFNPAACRLSLEHIVTREHALAAELDGRIVGKINTNAESFSRFQLGGVYVLPQYRGRGIATRMAAALVQRLVSRGKGVTLFVKERNPAARAVYSRIGFAVTGDYRICYY